MTAEPAAATTSNTGSSVSDWATYKRLLGYVKPHWFFFVVAVMGFQIGSAAEAFFVKLFGDLIDSWPNAALTIPLMMFGAVIARGLGEVVGELLLSRISFSVVHELRTQLFDQLLSMPSAYFDASSQGHLVSRITYNVAQLRDTGTDALKSIVQDGGKLIVYLGFMLYLSWKLTLIFVATAPLVGLVVMFASRRFRRISRRIQNSMGDVTHVASETVAGYRVVRTYGGEPYERQRFHKSSQSNRRQNVKMVATKVFSTQLIQIFVVAALSVLIGLLLQPEIGGSMSVGNVVVFLGLAGMLARPIKKLSEINARLQRGLAAAEDVFGQLDQESENDDGEHTVDRLTGHLQFENVNFTYDQGAGQVLEDLNLSIEPGQTVAVVGRSGSGKSTLASLIPRFYEPDSGRILLDGRPLADYRLQSLRAQIALVTQQVTLFNDTLANNIAYGSLSDATAEEIAGAVTRAHADEFISDLPAGLATVVGDDGVLLSGGQRQRVAIARALLKDAPLLILDEATSSLDTTSERQIQAALEEVMRGRTTIVIAHRLSTIEKADVIVVMDKGRIVESGTHESLLARDGLYAELYNAQFEDEEAPGQVVPDVPVSAHRIRVSMPAVEQTLGPLGSAWYSGSLWPKLLLPFGWLFARAAARRRLRYRTGKLDSWRAPVPVIVVGNITAGGTGKTPFVVWLAERLRTMGHRPGIVSRGYRGSASATGMTVLPDTPTELAGDEAPMLASRTGCPVFIGEQRCAAVRAAVENADVTIVIADDGLQHYALARDLEIVVVDGQRGLGNGLPIPAGPLREPAARLDEVDWVISTGKLSGLRPDETLMQLVPLRFVALADAATELSSEAFARRFREVHAVAGVGNPHRFAATLRELGLHPLLHAYPDHHRYSGREFHFDDNWPIVITEKDATKIRELESVPENLWYLEVGVDLQEEGAVSAVARLESLLKTHGISPP